MPLTIGTLPPSQRARIMRDTLIRTDHGKEMLLPAGVEMEVTILDQGAGTVSLLAEYGFAFDIPTTHVGFVSR